MICLMELPKDVEGSSCMICLMELPNGRRRKQLYDLFNGTS